MSGSALDDRVAGISSLVMHRLSGFAALLRDRDLPVGAPEVMRAIDTLNALGLSEPGSLYWGLRIAMVRRSEHLSRFDEAFEEYWGRVLREGQEQDPAAPHPNQAPPAARGDGEEREGTGAAPSGRSAGDSDAEAGEERAPRAVYSDVEILRKDFADYTEDDERFLPELLAEFHRRGPWRLSRRKRRHRKGPLDIRRTVRSGFQTQGHPVRRMHHRATPQQRRLTFVCDVSGSMETYSRAVLQLAHVALVRRRRVEAFAFATRLTRITRELLTRDPGLAVRSAAEVVTDWSGGTRVGECLADLNRSHRAALQGAAVVIASDGWDLGDPELLAAEAALLQRIAYSVVWVNPHLQDPAFEPLTRGMSAALPHVDHFMSCHNFETFLQLIAVLDEM